LAINTNFFPWVGGKQAYGSKLELFLAVYLRFCVNEMGVCTVSYSELAEILGLSLNGGKAAHNAREKISNVIKGLVTRGKEDFPNDFICFGVPNKKDEDIRINDAFKIPVKSMKREQIPPFVVVELDDFFKIVSAAKNASIKPDELFALYVFLKGWMRPVAFDEGKDKSLGCWLCREQITTSLHISVPTYMKYRKILEENELIFFKQGQAQISPALFSTTNNPAIWTAIEDAILAEDNEEVS